MIVTRIPKKSPRLNVPPVILKLSINMENLRQGNNGTAVSSVIDSLFRMRRGFE
jgi:hypothetical protein